MADKCEIAIKTRIWCHVNSPNKSVFYNVLFKVDVAMLRITGTKPGLLAFWQTLLAACLVQYTGLFHLHLVALVH